MVEILSGATTARSVAQAVPLPSLKASSVDAAGVSEKISSDFYLSPVIRFDPETLSVIFELRDSRSGEVTKQFPPERAVRELQKTADLTVDPFESSQKAPAEEGSSDVITSAVQTGGEPPSGSGSDQEVDVLI